MKNNQISSCLKSPNYSKSFCSAFLFAIRDL